MSLDKEKIIRLIFIFSLIFFSLIIVNKIQPENALIKEGFLDFIELQSKSDKAVALNGVWKFSPKGNEAQPIYVQVPGKWNNYLLNGEKMGSYGQGTYSIKILLEPGEIYYLKTNNIYTAYKIYLNSQLIGQLGQVGQDKTQHQPEAKVKIISFRPLKADNELKIEVSNFSHNKGGIRENIIIGNLDSIKDLDKNRNSIYMLIIGFLLTTAFIYFSMGYYTGREKIFGYIALFLTGLAVRLLFTADLLITTLLPGLSWMVIIKGDYLSYYVSVIFFILFVFKYLEQEINFWVKLILSFYLINSLIVIFSPPYIFSRILYFVNIVTLILALYILYLIIVVTIREKQTRRGLLFGTIFLLLSSIIEIVSTHLGSKIITSFTTGVIVFVTILIIEVNKNFSLKITSEREQIEILEDISNRDGLTGLFNHRYICQKAEEIQKKKMVKNILLPCWIWIILK